MQILNSLNVALTANLMALGVYKTLTVYYNQFITML